MATVVVPAVFESMSNTVIIDDLKITRYNHSIQYDSKVSIEEGYEITYNQKSYGRHAINVIFYSKNGKVLYNDSNYVGTCYLGDVPYQVHWMKKRITQYLKYTEPIWIMASAYIVKELMLTMLM